MRFVAQPLRVAAFDFDHTLTTRSTIAPFMARLVGRRRLALAVARAVVASGFPPARQRFKCRLARAVFTGLPHDTVRRVADQFAADLMNDGLDEEMLARLERHRRGGHRLVIVTSALDVYVRPVADRLGVDDVIATQVEVDAGGHCTGALVDADLWGEKKPALLLHRLGVDADPSSLCLWAYGDSKDDEPLRELARTSARDMGTSV
jgi:phosphatidylglycerophosphatase C